jgi:hypothetical protein
VAQHVRVRAGAVQRVVHQAPDRVEDRLGPDRCRAVLVYPPVMRPDEDDGGSGGAGIRARWSRSAFSREVAREWVRVVRPTVRITCQYLPLGPGGRI